MNKNWIRGHDDGTSGQRTTKSISIKRRRGKSSRRAGKVAKLTSGDLPLVPATGLRASQDALTRRQESAEGVVVRSVARANEAPPSRKTRERLGPDGNGGGRPERSRAASRN